MKKKLIHWNPSNPFFAMFHPFDASYDIRFKDFGSAKISCAILVLWFLAVVMERQNTGFIFNYNKVSDINIFLVLAKALCPFLMWVCGNWVISILMNGTGRFRDIFIVSAYSLLPFTLAKIGSVALSNILVRNEPFAQYVSLFGMGWSIIVIFIGTMIMHEYGFKRNLAAILFSVCVMAVILFFFVLIGNLLTEFINFIKTIVSEFLFRL